MSYLKLFHPDGADSGNILSSAGDDPAILSFPVIVNSRKSERLNLMIRETVHRASQLNENKICPHCDHPGVEPVELNDAHLNRNSHAIPGTATLVGFRCQKCLQEWPL